MGVESSMNRPENKLSHYTFWDKATTGLLYSPVLDLMMSLVLLSCSDASLIGFMFT